MLKFSMGGMVLSVSCGDQELAKICADHLIPTENQAASDFEVYLNRLNGAGDQFMGNDSYQTFRCRKQVGRCRPIAHGMEVFLPDDRSPILSDIVSILMEGYYALAREKGRGEDLFLHAAGIIDRNGMGYAFAGPSGCGKTTIARLCPDGFQVVHDELLLVSERNGKKVLSGGPIRTGFSVLRGEFPVRAVFLLSHGQETQIRRLKGSQAVFALLPPVLIPSYFFHRSWGDFVTSYFRLAFGLVARVPIYSLSFSPDRGVWDRVMEQIERDRSSVIARSGATKQTTEPIGDCFSA